MTVEVTGFAELERALKSLPKATGKNVLRRVAKGAMEPMAQRARSLAPVAEGDLRDSIQVSEKRTRRVARINRFDRNSGIQMSMGPVSGGAVLNYATFVEFGTSEMRARPYMRPAWFGGRDEMLDYVKTNLGLEINKAVARYSRRRLK